MIKSFTFVVFIWCATCSAQVPTVARDSRKAPSAETLVTGDAEHIRSVVAESAGATLKFYFTPRPPLPGTEPSLVYPAGWSITGQKLTVPNGGFTSAWITQIEGWDADQNGEPLLRSFQDKIDANGFLGANAIPSNSNCDLVYPARSVFACQKACVGGVNDGMACSTPGQCPKSCVGGSNSGAMCTSADQCPGGACPATSCVDPCPGLLGEPGSECGGRNDGYCDWGWQNTTRSDWVLGANAPNDQYPLDNIDSPTGPVFAGTTSPGVEIFDAGLRYYTGTLVLPVPDCCKGTYTIGHGGYVETFAQDQAQPANYIPIAELIAGQLECTPGYPGPFPILVAADPPTGHNLWRVQRNIIRLRFDGVITLPAAEDIQIREITGTAPDCGTFGPNVNVDGAFTFALGGICVGGVRDGKLCGHDADCGLSGISGACNLDNKTLTIQEVGSTFQHQHWYEISSTGWDDVVGWGVGPALPNIQYLALVGDANDNGRVDNADAGVVNGRLICLANCGDNNRADMNGDGRVQNNDTGIVNAHVVSLNVPKPCGH